MLHLWNVFLIWASLVDCTINSCCIFEMYFLFEQVWLTAQLTGGTTLWSKPHNFLSSVCFQRTCVGGRYKNNRDKNNKNPLGDGHLMNNVTKRERCRFLLNTDSNEKLSNIFSSIFVNFTLDQNWIRLLSEKFNIGWALNIMRKIFHTLTIKPANKADCCVKKFSTFELWEFKVKSGLNFSTEIVFWPIPSTKYFEQRRLVERVNNFTLLKATKMWGKYCLYLYGQISWHDWMSIKKIQKSDWFRDEKEEKTDLLVDLVD